MQIVLLPNFMECLLSGLFRKNAYSCRHLTNCQYNYATECAKNNFTRKEIPVFLLLWFTGYRYIPSKGKNLWLSCLMSLNVRV